MSPRRWILNDEKSRKATPRQNQIPSNKKKTQPMKKLLLTITMLAMALTAQASPSNAEAATAVAGGVGILGLTWLAFVIIGIVWLIFPFVVWVKLNRIIQNTRNAAEKSLGLYTVARQEFEKPQIQP